jgi:hypothetical protein
MLLPPRSALAEAPVWLTPIPSTLTTTPSYSLMSCRKNKIQSFDFNGKVSGTGFGAIHFQGSSLRQVSCYTLLSGCQLPWPPTCCLKKPTPFMGSFSQYFGPLTSRLVHPTAPVLLTKTSPLGTRIHKHTSIKKVHCLTHLEFENGQRIIRPQNP